MQAILAALAGCVTEVPEIRPPTSEEMIEALPEEQPPEPAPAPASEPGGGPIDVDMHGVRGTAVGTRVRLNGFFVEAEPNGALVSADSEGATMMLRCLGKAPSGIAPETPVEVVGTTAAPDREVIVLTECAVATATDEGT
jgi:hypothetical protein